MWLIAGATQTLAFVDPKGLRNVGSLQHPKVALHEKIRTLQKELGDIVQLRSFLISNTELAAIEWAHGLTQTEFENAGVFFQSDDQHIVKLLDAATRD